MNSPCIYTNIHLFNLNLSNKYKIKNYLIYNIKIFYYLPL